MAKKQNFIRIKRGKNIAKGREEVFTLHIIVCVHLAYKPQTCETGHSRKPNAWILDHMNAMKHLDPWGEW